LSCVSYIINEPYIKIMSRKKLNSHAQSIKDLSVPDEINSSTAKLVYVYLKSVMSATLEEICKSLSLKQLTLLPILDSLRKNGLIKKSNQVYTIKSDSTV